MDQVNIRVDGQKRQGIARGHRNIFIDSDDHSIAATAPCAR